MRSLLRFLPLGGLFLLEQSPHTTPRLISPTGGGILNLVATVVAGLPTLGSLPELDPQTFQPVIQPAANKFLRYSFYFLL